MLSSLKSWQMNKALLRAMTIVHLAGGISRNCAQWCESLMRSRSHGSARRFRKDWSPYFAGMCVASVSYAGPCPPTAYFNALSADEKKKFQKRCAGICSAPLTGSARVSEVRSLLALQQRGRRNRSKPGGADRPHRVSYDIERSVRPRNGGNHWQAQEASSVRTPRARQRHIAGLRP